jgi:hypothetical protein
MSISKSYEDYVLGLYEAMFFDIAESIPSLRKDCNRDYKRLLSCVEHHGAPFFLVILVQFAKHFDRCLADERLTLSHLTHFGPFKSGSTVPRLFKGLVLRVFDVNGDLLSIPDVQAIRFIRTLCMLTKNAKLVCPTQRTFEHVQEFVRTDGEVRLPSLAWDSPDFRAHSARDLQFGDDVLCSLFNEPILPFREDGNIKPPSKGCRDDYAAVQLAADIVTSTLGRFEASDWRFRHGPGAVADKRGPVLDKYRFTRWPAMLEKAFPYADFAFANFNLWAEHLNHEVVSLDPLEDQDIPSRLLAVPKTYKGPRLIAAEPTAHQWCQQALRDFLMTRVSATPITRSIDFVDQTKNGNLALEASRDGSHATIDLSEASDRISCYLIERFFRRSPDLLDAFQGSRTRWITQDLDKKSPRLIKLRKFSTMGSAITFPVQTIVFATIANVACLLCKHTPVTISSLRKVSQEVQVFGDDIIVPTYAWSKTMELLEIFGLKINTSKTFGTGRFRESCGVDAYHGHIVSKVNVNHAPSSTSPESIVSSVDCHNNLLSAGFCNAASYVRQAVDRMRNFRIPEVCFGSGIMGWYSLGEPRNERLKDRWNPMLHRREFLVSVQSAPSERVPYHDGCSVTQYFTECARSNLPIKGDRLGIPQSIRSLKLKRSWVPLPCS